VDHLLEKLGGGLNALLGPAKDFLPLIVLNRLAAVECRQSFSSFVLLAQPQVRMVQEPISLGQFGVESNGLFQLLARFRVSSTAIINPAQLIMRQGVGRINRLGALSIGPDL